MPGNIVDRIDDRVPVRTALISVFDKTGLDDLIAGLVAACPDVRILSTGGTHAFIARALGDGAAARLSQVSDYTGQPETQGGLVKTLDFRIYLGLLTETYNDAHQADIARTGASPIDLAVVNLYPFGDVIARDGTTVEEARANIDIGGPCMIRASAKNYLRVASVTSAADYGGLLSHLAENGGATRAAYRFELAKKAFAYTAAYDTRIASYLFKHEGPDVAGIYTFED
ncbi:hypothetical protein K8I61_16065 [bacterium]|nr:hypothetical protein [bacterium]